MEAREYSTASTTIKVITTKNNGISDKQYKAMGTCKGGATTDNDFQHMQHFPNIVSLQDTGADAVDAVITLFHKRNGCSQHFGLILLPNYDDEYLNNFPSMKRKQLIRA